MCYRPIQLHIRSIDPLVSACKTQFVRCGKCAECLEVKRSELVSRLIAEYITCQEKHGFALFFTLTYDKAHLPFIPLTKTPCFRKEDVVKYFKRVRKTLSKHCNIDVSNGGFRYAIFCEYGGKHARPHMHAIAYINRPVNTIGEKFNIRAKILNAWGLGRTYGSKINYGFVENKYALQYCAKYVNKNSYEMSLLHDFRNNPLAQVRYHNAESLKPFEPFTHVSNGLGYDYALRVPFDDFVKNQHRIDAETTICIPSYWRKKRLYDVVKYVDINSFDVRKNDYGVVRYRFVLNDFGREVTKEFYKKYVIPNINVSYSNILTSVRDDFNLTKVGCDIPDYATFKIRFRNIFPTPDDYAFYIQHRSFTPPVTPIIAPDYIPMEDIINYKFYSPFSSDLSPQDYNNYVIGNYTIAEYQQYIYNKILTYEKKSEQLFGAPCADLVNCIVYIQKENAKLKDFNKETIDFYEFHNKSVYYANK